MNSEPLEERKKNFVFYKKWGDIYNFLFAKYQDVTYENPFYIDPKLCLKRIQGEKFYFLNSENFAFQLQIPFKYQFSKLQDFAFVNEGTHQWKALVFKERFQEPNLEEYSLQDMLDFLSRKKPIPKQIGGKLFVFFLEHKYDRFSPKLMLDFWDRKRGLTVQNLNQFQFQRIYLEKESSSKFQILESNGEEIKYECKEKVFGKENRSVGIFFVYPTAQKEIYEKDFQLMKLQFK